VSTDFDYAYGGDYGVNNATPPLTTDAPDASGGAGSFLKSLLPVLTQGVQATLAAKINDKYGEGISSGLATVDANGNLVYKATPVYTPTSGTVVAQSALQSPVLLIGLAIAAVALIALLRK
jgi:hypothetical protein